MARKSRKNTIVELDNNFKVYKTAIYARLSREGQKKEKIETQIDEVKTYIEKRGFFKLVDVYADGGVPGAPTRISSINLQYLK